MRAFAEIQKLYEPRIFRFVQKMCPREEDAKDITAMVLIRAWRFIKSYNTNLRFSTWLFTIAKRVWYDWIKKEQSWVEEPLPDQNEEEAPTCKRKRARLEAISLDQSLPEGGGDLYERQADEGEPFEADICSEAFLIAFRKQLQQFPGASAHRSGRVTQVMVDAFWLRHVECKKLEEISQALGIALASAKKYSESAAVKEELRRLYEQTYR